MIGGAIDQEQGTAEVASAGPRAAPRRGRGERKGMEKEAGEGLRLGTRRAISSVPRPSSRVCPQTIGLPLRRAPSPQGRSHLYLSPPLDARSLFSPPLTPRLRLYHTFLTATQLPSPTKQCRPPSATFLPSSPSSRLPSPSRRRTLFPCVPVDPHFVCPQSNIAFWTHQAPAERREAWVTVADW